MREMRDLETGMDDEKLLPDLLLAITVTAILFGFMVVVDNALSVEPEPIQEFCHDRYQLSTKAVLSCPALDRQSK